MAHGTIEIRLRPIKFAFLVDPSDKAGLLEAIEINTFLWGGMYNPIIPTSERVPKVFREKRPKGPSSREILSGYLDAFDPDYVVPLGKCTGRHYDVGYRETIDCSEILAGIRHGGKPRYGIGLFELVNHFIYREFRFVRREPLEVFFLHLDRRYRAFLASVFGCLPEDISEQFEREFMERLGAKRYSCSIADYSQFLSPGKLFLRRLSSLYVRAIRRRVNCLFFLDAANSTDVMDYWNLRAMGWNVLPIPKQASGSQKTRRVVEEFIEDSFRPNRHNPKIHERATLVKARSVTIGDMRAFVGSLTTSLSDKEGNPKLMQQHWYPRMWDEWARDRDDVISPELEALTREDDIADTKRSVVLRTLDPSFAAGPSVYGGARFANEIELRLYGSEDSLAEVFPEGGDALASAIGLIGFREWRFSKRGMVYLSQHTEWSVSLPLPKAEDVFSQWLRCQGWTIEVSPPGRIARQMLRQLGGLGGTSTLVNEGLLELLRQMADGKTENARAFWGKIQKLASKDVYRRNADHILRRVIDVQMFRLGLELQCPVCTHYSWHSLKDADYQLHCPICLTVFPVPCHSPQEIVWSYRSYGPFTVPNRAHGAYSVLLVLRFFSHLLHARTTPMMSFTAKKNGREIEADLSLFIQHETFSHTRVDLLFVECKSYRDPFRTEDTKRLSTLGEHFPGALLVFATLKGWLTENEKKLLRPLANRARRNWLAGRSCNPVLILTGTELFAGLGPPQCWKKGEEKHKAFADDWRVLHDLRELCDVTQCLYLDMQSRDQLIAQVMEKRQRASKT